MSNDETAVPRLVAIDRRQLILRTMDVEKLVEPEHCVRSIWELVGRLDLRLYYAQIAAVVVRRRGQEHADRGFHEGTRKRHSHRSEEQAATGNANRVCDQVCGGRYPVRIYAAQAGRKG